MYQHDLTPCVEDLRTPLSTLLDLDKRLRGTLSGFMMPSFVVDLPGGGGKRLASTVDKYEPTTGVSEWSAPGLPGPKGERKYKYYDPYPLPVTAEGVQRLRKQQDLMYKCKSTREKDFIRHWGEIEVPGDADPQHVVACTSAAAATASQ